MDASDLLPHRAAMIGAAIALAIGLAGGLALKVGAQTAPETDSAFADETASLEAQPIAWPAGKVPDYVIGTDFLRPPPEPTPVVVASYEVPEYVPTAWPETWSATGTEPTPRVQPVRLDRSEERPWPSTGGDILDTRLPEDAPAPPEPPRVVEAPDAPAPSPASAPMTMAAVY